VVSIPPERASQYAEDLHGIYSPELARILDVNLPVGTQARFNTFFDGLDLSGLDAGVPEWVQDLHAVMDTITAAYYHQRRIAEIERTVVDALSRAVQTIPRLPVRSNSTLRTMTISYEYHAFLFAYRRAFEYLSIGICRAYDVTPPRYIHQTAEELKSADQRNEPWVGPMAAQITAVARRFKRTLANRSPRNLTAHHRPAQAGSMRIWLDPGLEPRIGIEEGAEELPMRDVIAVPGESLGDTLDRQLQALVDAVFELLALLPRPAYLLRDLRLM
jgi:hypothetical protein